MKSRKISVIIPYARRINNIKYALQSLDKQQFSKDDYEVIIGCLEYSLELLNFVNKEVPKLNVVLVMSNEAWNVSRARNIAIREATGEILVFIDADIIVPEDFLDQTYHTHAKSMGDLLVIGQMRDYSGFDVGDMLDYSGGQEIHSVVLQPFAYYQENYLGKKADELELPMDVRWKMDIHINWAMAWTFNLSVPARVILQNKILFDENFKGWGVEDIDWAYRISKQKVKFHFSDDIWGIHLDHERNDDRNHREVKINFKKMLYKWPEFDVEIITAFGDIVGNERYNDIKKNMELLTAPGFSQVCVLELNSAEQTKFLYIGGCKDPEKNSLGHINLPDELADCRIRRILPLSGVSLPYADKSIAAVYYAPAVSRLDNFLAAMIDEEAERLSDRIVR